MDPEFKDPLLQTVRTTATSDPHKVLHDVYATAIDGNFDACAHFLTDDVELNISGFAPMQGSWRGRSAVIEAMRRNFGLVTSQQPVIENMISQSDCVGVLLTESGVLKSTGETYRIRAVQWFTFSDGRIKKIDQIAASAPI